MQKQCEGLPLPVKIINKPTTFRRNPSRGGSCLEQRADYFSSSIFFFLLVSVTICLIPQVFNQHDSTFTS